ncbi:hypothetical protein [Sinosporangium siamense]|uniref:Uncharacterized protein n=1 Tax=Sinosporangium siamense TaxID=1367973 RepID=A0A919V499_9ACTN|nr:hypothetical protein [Sinosporangium siamense]GII91740.1 hypothetical protein Ssi02_19710 [Sinosporangium siamense]
MTKLTVVPEHLPVHKVRHIRSAAGHRRTADAKVVDLRAYTGRNVLHFPSKHRPHKPHKNGPTPAA